MQKIIDQFYFMNYSFGKALFSGFIATLTFSSYWLQLAVAIFFATACGGFIVLGLLYTKQESENAPAKAPGNVEAKPGEVKKEQELENKLPAPQV